jgi:hypothetical protein
MFQPFFMRVRVVVVSLLAVVWRAQRRVVEVLRPVLG